MEDIKWKSDKDLDAMKTKMRQEIILEIQECCKCKNCKRLEKYKNKYM